MGNFSPSNGEIFGIRNGLMGWCAVGGLGPEFFAPLAVEAELRLAIEGRTISAEARESLAGNRARVVNFYNLIKPGAAFKPVSASQVMHEVTLFVSQLTEQSVIWRDGFRSLHLSEAEIAIHKLILSKSSPVLFNMGFADAIPHSAQVSRLTASMAKTLGGTPSEILQATIVGQLHDPKFHPDLDLEQINLATHPVNAAALASAIFEDLEIHAALEGYCEFDAHRVAEFSNGVVDALAINNDSRFVQMMVILPSFVRRIGEVYGEQIAGGFKAIMEDRLESASRGGLPANLPPHLHGLLAQVRLDSGLRGISKHAWIKAVAQIAESIDPVGLFWSILDGEHLLDSSTLEKLRTILLTTVPSPILKAEVNATSLLHHHQEVVPSGQIAASALVVADPMMLSPHKVASVYNTAIIERLRSFIRSFDDNVRLLPKMATTVGALWARAVYLSMLDAADQLNGTDLMRAFRSIHTGSSVAQCIDCLRALLIRPETWGNWAQAQGAASPGSQVEQVLRALEEAYVRVVNQYRESVYAGESLIKFFPVR